MRGEGEGEGEGEGLNEVNLIGRIQLFVHRYCIGA